MFSISMAFLLGCCSVYLGSHLLNIWLIMTLAGMALTAALYFRSKIFLLSFVTLLASFWMLFHVGLHRDHRLPDALEGQTISVEGYISSLPEYHTHAVNFLFKAHRVAGVKRNLRIRLSWYGQYPKELRVGDKWELIVRLKKPHSYHNPGSFDQEAWLFLRDIGATGYVYPSLHHRLIESKQYVYTIQRLRQALRDRVYQWFPHQAQTGFLTALLVGSREQFTEDQWQILRQTGTNHLMAIAGLHIGLLAGLFFWISQKIVSRMPRVCLRWPAPTVAAGVSFIAAFWYGLLAGFPLQTQRAMIMLGIVLGSILCRKRVFSWNNLSCALLIILILNPLEVLDESFWMSFWTVFVIILSSQGVRGASRVFNHYVRIQWVIMVGIFPLMLLFYHDISGVSFVANSLAIPWFAFIIIPGCFLGGMILPLFPSLAHFILWLILANLKLFWVVLTFLAQWPFSHGHFPFPSISVFIFVLAGVFIMLLPRGFPGRYLACFCFLPLITLKPNVPASGEIWFDVLDVGQGLSCVVQTKNHLLVYDTGPRYGLDWDAAKHVIVPFLERKNLKFIDRVVVSHGDSDHIGGLSTLLKSIPVQQVLTSVPQQVDSGFHAVTSCFRGQHWQWDQVDFQLLSPKKNTAYEGNDSSCVLKITTGTQGILLTGDIESAREQILVQDERKDLPSTLLVAPHHGSRTSSTQAFIEAVHPRYVAYATGYRNRFHFPSVSVEKRYAENQVKGLNTAQVGDISVDMMPNDLQVSTDEEKNSNLWR